MSQASNRTFVRASVEGLAHAHDPVGIRRGSEACQVEQNIQRIPHVFRAGLVSGISPEQD